VHWTVSKQKKQPCHVAHLSLSFLKRKKKDTRGVRKRKRVRGALIDRDHSLNSPSSGNGGWGGELTPEKKRCATPCFLPHGEKRADFKVSGFSPLIEKGRPKKIKGQTISGRKGSERNSSRDRTPKINRERKKYHLVRIRCAAHESIQRDVRTDTIRERHLRPATLVSKTATRTVRRRNYTLSNGGSVGKERDESYTEDITVSESYSGAE